MEPHRDLGHHLDRLVRQVHPESLRERDPVGRVHRYARPCDQELIGLLAASVAFGQVGQVLKTIDRVAEVLGPHPARVLSSLSLPTLKRRLRGVVHRIYRGHHLATLLFRAARLQQVHGSLGAFFDRSMKEYGDIQPALAALNDGLRGASRDRSMRHLVPDPRSGSACKRSLLFVRWMVRPADGVDLGLWSTPPSALLIPVDTHVHRIARNLGLTDRRDASWKTAVEITHRLRRYDPEDPVKYDFALCHLGISKRCPSRFDPDACTTCVLQPTCLAAASA